MLGTISVWNSPHPGPPGRGEMRCLYASGIIKRYIVCVSSLQMLRCQGVQRHYHVFPITTWKDDIHSSLFGHKRVHVSTKDFRCPRRLFNKPRVSFYHSLSCKHYILGYISRWQYIWFTSLLLLIALLRVSKRPAYRSKYSRCLW